MIIHVVKSGDTVYNISKKYNTTMEKIIKDNGLVNPESLIIGETIVITDTNNTRQRAVNVTGYAYPFIKQEDLMKSIPYLSVLNVFSYMVDEVGNLTNINDKNLIDASIKYNTLPTMVITNLGENTGFNSNVVSSVLNNEAYQENLINNIMYYLRTKGYAGLDVDFEYIYAKDKLLYERFLRKLAYVLHPAGYVLSVAIPPKYSDNEGGDLFKAYDYATIGRIADRVLLMTYEWGYIAGPPMAVSPIYEVERIVSYAVTQIDSSKILMGIPNYGYDWKIPFKEGDLAKVISNTEAIEIAKRYGSNIEFDTKAQAPYFKYYDKDIKQHEVWFEDARSIKAKLELADKYNLVGVFYWTIMKPFKQNWTILSDMFYIIKYV